MLHRMIGQDAMCCVCVCLHLYVCTGLHAFLTADGNGKVLKCLFNKRNVCYLTVVAKEPELTHLKSCRTNFHCTWMSWPWCVTVETYGSRYS
jgi:hypothetical protein